MTQAIERTVKNGIDPRIVRVQAERAAKTIKGTIVSSPLWLAFLAFLTSDQVPFLGSVPLAYAAWLVGVVGAAVLGAYIILKVYARSRDAGLTPEAASE